MFSRLFIFIVFTIWSSTIVAQSANPFELIHRLPRVTVAPDGQTVVAAPRNPFDIVVHRAPGQTEALGVNKTTRFRPFAVLPTGGGLSGGTLFGVLAVIFTILTLSIAANRGAVEKAWRGFLNESSLTLAQRDASGFVGSTPYYLLYLNFLLNAGVFLFLITRFFRRETYNNFWFLIFCIIVTSIFFLSKHLMVKIMAQITPIEKDLRRYQFLMLIFNCVLGLFLLPFNLVIAFGTDTGYYGFLVFWTLALVAIFFGYRAFRALPIGLKFLGENTFHFLLYLCTVEIAPLVLVVKMATLQT